VYIWHAVRIDSLFTNLIKAHAVSTASVRVQVQAAAIICYIKHLNGTSPCKKPH